MQKIQTDKAPKAIGAYSQSVVFGNLIFTSGQISLKPDMTMVKADITLQTKQVLQNIEEILKQASSSKNNILKTTLFLTDIKNFTKANEIYEEFFGSHKPARSAVIVKELPRNALIEIEAIAYKNAQ